jgi:hypothetical protein
MDPKTADNQRQSGVTTTGTGNRLEKPEVHPALSQTADQQTANNHLDKENRKWTEELPTIKKNGAKSAETGSKFKKPEVHPAPSQPADQPITNNHSDRENRKSTQETRQQNIIGITRRRRKPTTKHNRDSKEKKKPDNKT